MKHRPRFSLPVKGFACTGLALLLSFVIFPALAEKQSTAAGDVSNCGAEERTAYNSKHVFYVMRGGVGRIDKHGNEIELYATETMEKILYCDENYLYIEQCTEHYAKIPYDAKDKASEGYPAKYHVDIVRIAADSGGAKLLVGNVPRYGTAADDNYLYYMSAEGESWRMKHDGNGKECSDEKPGVAYANNNKEADGDYYYAKQGDAPGTCDIIKVTAGEESTAASVAAQVEWAQYESVEVYIAGNWTFLYDKNHRAGAYITKAELPHTALNILEGESLELPSDAGKTSQESNTVIRFETDSTWSIAVEPDVTWITEFTPQEGGAGIHEVTFRFEANQEISVRKAVVCIYYDLLLEKSGQECVRILVTQMDVSKVTKDVERENDQEMREDCLALLDDSQYTKSAWKSAGVNRKKEILENLLFDIQEILNTDVKPEIAPVKGDPGWLGYYSAADNQMVVNEDVFRLGYQLAEGFYDDGYDLLRTIVHECRHAYQWETIQGKGGHLVSAETVEQWRANYSQSGYTRAQDNFGNYLTQPIEWDAHYFAGQQRMLKGQTAVYEGSWAE